jgi:methyltransferase (TIGR00027 family)
MAEPDKFNDTAGPAVIRELPSSSAEGAAFLRAAESMKPEHRRVCYDPLAGNFLGSKKNHFLSDTRLLKKFILDKERKTPGAFGCVAGRTRYIDDYLRDCIESGIEQLVILGAGYDSRPYRFHGLTGGVKVFELDRQATQKVKIERVVKLLGSLPDNVVYVIVDLEKEKPGEKLLENGYDRNLKTLFIWEGVTMYISAEAVDDTLAFAAANSGKGSSIIFNYISKSFLDGTYESEYAGRLRKDLEGGEPFRFSIDAGSIGAFLAERGFDLVKNVDGDFFKRAYFTGKNRSRKVCRLCGFATAKVRQ